MRWTDQDGARRRLSFDTFEEAERARLALELAQTGSIGGAAHDWSSVLDTAPEFAVFLDEHDAGVEPMWQSLVTINPPGRVARWTTRWPHP